MYLAAQLGVEGPLPWRFRLVNALKYWCFSSLLLEPSLQAASLRRSILGKAQMPSLRYAYTLHYVTSCGVCLRSLTGEMFGGQKRCSTTKDENVSSCLHLCSCCVQNVRTSPVPLTWTLNLAGRRVPAHGQSPGTEGRSFSPKLSLGPYSYLTLHPEDHWPLDMDLEVPCLVLSFR